MFDYKKTIIFSFIVILFAIGLMVSSFDDAEAMNSIKDSGEWHQKEDLCVTENNYRCVIQDTHMILYKNEDVYMSGKIYSTKVCGEFRIVNEDTKDCKAFYYDSVSDFIYFYDGLDYIYLGK